MGSGNTVEWHSPWKLKTAVAEVYSLYILLVLFPPHPEVLSNYINCINFSSFRLCLPGMLSGLTSNVLSPLPWLPQKSEPLCLYSFVATLPSIFQHNFYPHYVVLVLFYHNLVAQWFCKNFRYTEKLKRICSEHVYTPINISLYLTRYLPIYHCSFVSSLQLFI